MTAPRPLMRALSLARFEFTREYAGREPWQITMSSATRDALYREMFGDVEGEDMRTGLRMTVAIAAAMPEGTFTLE